MQWVPFILWIISHAILLFGVIGLVRHSRFKKSPFFFSYIAYNEALFAALLTITLWIHHGGPRQLYPWLLVVGTGISSCLQLAVFYEVVQNLILPRSPALTALRPLLRWAIASVAIVSAGISAAFSTAGLRPLTHIFEVLNFGTNLINLSLLLVLFVFTKAFHISWKSLPAGIALGFGINSSLEIGATSLLSTFGMNGVFPDDILRMSAYLACTFIWVVYVFLPEAQPEFSGQGVQKTEMEAWQKQLHGIIDGRQS